MSIPDYQSLMLPALRFAGDRKEHSVAELRQRISAEFSLSDKELAERLASDSQTVFPNQAARQFKEYKEFSCSVVLANPTSAFVRLADPWAILGAMLGNLGFTVPVGPN